MPVVAGQLLDRYRLLQTLGSGAFGSVWLAEDTWLSKKVALKIPHNQTLDFGKMIAEPKLLAALDHPNVIKLLTVDRTPEAMFMVMEYVEGKSLKERLAGGRLPVVETVRIALELLGALEYAHDKGVVHRDLKPANILLTPDGRVKITDFGTAHEIDAGDQTVAAGTLFYMSREQLLGRVTPASDLYSVGVMLYEMLTGSLPFHDTAGSRLIQKILSGEPAPLITAADPALPAPLATIVARALERDVKRRWGSAGEMRRALAAFESGQPLPAGPPPPPPPHPAYERFSRKAPRLAETLATTHEFASRGSWGGRGKQEGQFMLPAGLAADGAGRLWASDAIRCWVQAFDREGAFIKRLGSEGGAMDEGLRFHNPTALALDRDGRLFVCDTKNSRIVVCTEFGEPVASIGRPLVVVGAHDEQGVVGFNYPRGIALDLEEGILYVADTGNHRIRSFSLAGVPLKPAGSRGDRPGEFDSPLGLAIGGAGRLYVADSQNFRIQVFDRGLKFRESFGRRGTRPGEFMHPPVHVAVTVNGDLVVCDASDRVQILDADGAPIGAGTGRREGPSGPHFIAAALVEPEDLYLADEHGCAVQRFSLRERAA